MKEISRVLVLRMGALGDLVMCRQAFSDIRQAHPNAEIALLTTPPFENFVRSMPWFDTVIAAERVPFTEVGTWFKQIAQLYRFAPNIVYDLQGKFRQNVIFWLMGGPLWGPTWSGAVKGCAYPRLWPPTPNMHFVDFLAAQLHKARVPAGPLADMSWLNGPLDGLPLPDRFALLIPGCSPKLLHKRWPVENYAELARRLKAAGIESVAIGTQTESETLNELQCLAPEVVNLCGQTSLAQIAALARRAVCTIGNDTGPMHLAAAVGSPTLAVLSGHTNPTWSRPYGSRTAWLKADPIEKVMIDEVFLALGKLGVS